MDGTLKARCVDDGHMTPDSDIFSYARVVSLESIRKFHTCVTLLEVDVHTSDIRSAYLRVSASEKQK